jgi:hypothetical protein
LIVRDNSHPHDPCDGRTDAFVCQAGAELYKVEVHRCNYDSAFLPLLPSWEQPVIPFT